MHCSSSSYVRFQHTGWCNLYVSILQVDTTHNRTWSGMHMCWDESQNHCLYIMQAYLYLDEAHSIGAKGHQEEESLINPTDVDI